MDAVRNADGICECSVEYRVQIDKVGFNCPIHSVYLEIKTLRPPTETALADYIANFPWRSIVQTQPDIDVATPASERHYHSMPAYRDLLD